MLVLERNELFHVECKNIKVAYLVSFLYGKGGEVAIILTFKRDIFLFNTQVAGKAILFYVG
jgi:hypothetical protein